MGGKAGRASKKDGLASTMRDMQIQVSYLWTRSAYRNLVELLRFRLLMIRLETSHPDIYQVVKNMHRGIDTRELGLYDGNTLKSEPDGSPSMK